MKAIYCIENKITSDRYVGSAVNFYNRKRLHLARLRKNEHHSYHLQNSWNKYGEEKFIFIILEEVENKEELIPKEQWWIDNTNSHYNICKIAGSSLGIKRTEETKKKVALANIGLKHPEWRNKIKSKSQGGDNHWTKKKNFSEESKKRMSKAHKSLYANGYSSPVAKTIIEIDSDGRVINRWYSLSQAGKYYAVSRTTISNIIEGRNSIKLKNKKFKYE